METLKLTSIRLENRSLEQANLIAKEYNHYTGSDVIRTALWVGLKIVNTRNLPKLSHLNWDEYAHGARYGLDDVIHAAALNNEGAR